VGWEGLKSHLNFCKLRYEHISSLMHSSWPILYYWGQHKLHIIVLADMAAIYMHQNLNNNYSFTAALK
jgi:hypothetical protein